LYEPKLLQHLPFLQHGRSLSHLFGPSPVSPPLHLHYNIDRVEREWVANNNLERSKRDSGNNCWLHGEVEIFSEFNFKFGHLGGMGGEVRKYFLDECFIFLTLNDLLFHDNRATFSSLFKRRSVPVKFRYEHSPSFMRCPINDYQLKCDSIFCQLHAHSLPIETFFFTVKQNTISDI
jgi:hypothetical protein